MKISKVHGSFRKWVGVLALAAALTAGMMGVLCTEITAYAESAGKVTADTAKIREEASTSSDAIGSTQSGDTVSITGQTTGEDGYTWYQIYVDADTKGYIRSDLVKITDGSTPSTLQSTTTTTTTTTTNGTTATTSTPDETVVDVTEVNPVSASVSGSSPVRVRQNASTTSRIVTTVEGGSALTVTGTATGTDSKQWYQVSFTSGGSEVNGFIRADYVTLSGELTEPGTETTETGTETTETGTETGTETASETTKDWDTYQSDDGLWHLQNNTSGEIYSITDIFDTVETNTEIANSANAANKTLKVVVIIMVVLLVGAVALAGFLAFKLKDMSDSAYYREVEQETMRRRAAGARGQDGRTASGRSASGQRTASHSGGQGQTRSASGSGQRRPSSAQGQARSASAANGQRMTENRSQAGSRPTADGARPTEGQRRSTAQEQTENVQQRPVRQAEEVMPAEQEQTTAETTARQAPKPAAQNGQAQKQGWKSKNFVADDDEFEFEFLNWDGDEES